MSKHTFTWKVLDTKTQDLIDEGSWESWDKEFKRTPSSESIPYLSHTTLIIADHNGKIVLEKNRKLLHKDLPKYVLPQGNYTVNIDWRNMTDWIEDHGEYSGQSYEDIMNPPFQRNRVWDRDQQVSYIEHILKGGQTGKDVYFNCSSWMRGDGDKNMYCVDGLQRITAVRAFLNNEFPVFDNIYVDDIERIGEDFIVHVLDFQTEKEILEWYLQLNTTGKAHTEEELNKVRDMLKEIK